MVSYFLVHASFLQIFYWMARSQNAVCNKLRKNNNNNDNNDKEGTQKKANNENLFIYVFFFMSLNLGI